MIEKYTVEDVYDMSANEIVEMLNNLEEENDFYFRIIEFFAKNPMTKYSGVQELLKEMEEFKYMELI